MLLFPSDRFQIQTSSDKEQIFKKLESVVEKPTWRILLWPFGKDLKTFAGKVYDPKFKIWRIIRYRNSFLPIVCGRIDESVIQITMRLHWFVAVFMALWLCVPTIFFILSFFGNFFPIVPEEKIRWISMRPIFLGFFIFGYVLCMICFNLEADKAKKILKETFV